MAELINILELNEGIALEDPTSATFYCVKNGQDYPIEYETLRAFFNQDKRAKGAIAATAGEQTITFEVGGVATPLASANYSILIWSDVEGMVTPTAQDENGFTVDLIDACNLNYQAILNT